MARARSPLPVARSRRVAGAQAETIAVARARQRKSRPPERRWLARSYLPAMDEKREWTNLGSCRGSRLLARPDEANQKTEANNGQYGQGNEETLKEGKPSHATGMFGQ
jgi:hypothetical protein